MRRSDRGQTNLITGVADAQLDRAPLVAITGQAGSARIFKESHQYVDVMALFRPVTKWNARLELPETVPEIVRKAFRLARMEKPGATHIELPEDVAAAPAKGKPIPVRRTTYPVARPESIEKAVELFRRRSDCWSWQGTALSGVRPRTSRHWHGAPCRLPCSTTFMGKGSLDYRVTRASRGGI